MQALYIDNQALSYLDDYPDPVFRGSEALIRVTGAGICSTDLELVKGYAGFRGVPGHEFVGVVEACSNSDWIGDRVVGKINVGCGECGVCVSHGPEHCLHRTVLGIINRDGAFAEYLSLPTTNLFKVPPEISDRSAIFVEPLAAALRISEQVVVPSNAPAAVIGPGKLGLLIGQALALSGAEVIMLGRRQESLQLAEKLGLQTDMLDAVEDDRFAFVVEATGNEEGLAGALRITRPQGTLVMKSTYSRRAHIDLTKVVVGEINLIGSRCGPFEKALRLLARGLIEVEKMIDAEYPLHDGVQAFSHASKPGARKILLRPS